MKMIIKGKRISEKVREFDAISAGSSWDCRCTVPFL